MRIEALHRRGNRVSLDLECESREDALDAFEKILALLERELTGVEVSDSP